MGQAQPTRRLKFANSCFARFHRKFDYSLKLQALILSTAKMLGKRKAVSMIPPPKKRRKASSAIEEIAFDFSAREDYLTGFHKRKLQRIKHAKEEASKKEREEKINARKLV